MFRLDHCCVRCPSSVFYSTAFLKLGLLSFQLAMEVRDHGLLAALKGLAVARLSDRINA